jgi:two-component system response regulator HydG
MERAVVLAKGEVLDLADLPEPIRNASRAKGEIRREGRTVVIPLGTKLEDVERVLIHETLKETDGDKTLAAQLLGIAARTIYRKLDAEKKRDEE